ncbi:Gag-Pol polyprotein [Trachymyrmex septentrionalis]|uniref:Gag-Pol polyprotein n=2 Tax=Trachymyrmex septentrionalis TaxID=34720 RepID=A0A195FYX8_9HYME|nr:Gag-Pol polyprotein [Trachymyrmex septentrionalis]
MGEARSKVPLAELGIVDTRLRRAQTGGLLIEIQGEDAGTKADSLAERLSSLFKEREDVRVIRPIRRMEFRLVDLDESVTADEIKEAVAARGRVPLSDVRVGPLRPRGGGLNSVWLQCPEPCAETIRKDGGLQVGWSRGRLIPLARRRLQCYRCLAVGHTRVNCRSAVDRSNRCFKCGKEGHKMIDCRASPHCPVCAARNLPAGHRAGGDGCAPYNGLVRATVAAAATVPESGSVPPSEDAMVVDG